MGEKVIWERPVDHDKIEQRTQRFLQWFGIPAALCIIVGLVFAGWQNALGIAVVLGVIGGFIGLWVRFSSLSEQANPTMSVVDGSIVMGRLSVPIEDVTDYTTFVTTVQTSLFGKRSRISIGKALFKTPSETVEFGWPKMYAEHLETVEAALEPVLPDRWKPPEDLIEVRPKRPRRSTQRLL